MEKEQIIEAVGEAIGRAKAQEQVAQEARIAESPLIFHVERASNGFIVRRDMYNTLGCSPKPQVAIAENIEQVKSYIADAITEKFKTKGD